MPGIFNEAPDQFSLRRKYDAGNYPRALDSLGADDVWCPCRPMRSSADPDAQRGRSRSRSVTERHPDAVARVEFRLLDQRSLTVSTPRPGRVDPFRLSHFTPSEGS